MIEMELKQKIGTDDQVDGKEVGMSKGEILGTGLFQGWLRHRCKSN